ncbi:hypothetical protein GQ600_5734 [Phytophthora cactorum]|nr:hypothetical protein GQ600_5734 [Phytophthora cactorum]
MSPNVVKWVFERHVLAATMQPRCQSTNHITLRTPPGYLNTHDGEAKAARLQVVWVSWWSGVDAAMSHLLHRHRHARDSRRLALLRSPPGWSESEPSGGTFGAPIAEPNPGSRGTVRSPSRCKLQCNTGMPASQLLKSHT